MIKKLGVRLLVAGAVLAAAAMPLSTPSFAQDAKVPAPVIVVIDVQSILRDSTAAKGVRAQRDKYIQTYQAEFAKDEDGLRQQDQELAKQRSVLSAEAFAEKRRGLEQQIGAFQRKVQSRRRALEQSYGRAMAQVQGALVKVTDELAQENGATMVMFKSQVFLFDPKMDITAPAVERLNQRLTSVEFPEPKEVEAAAPAAKGGKK